MKISEVQSNRRTVLLGGLGAGLATVLPVAPASAASTYRRGSRGAGVASLQRSLGARGYWCGRADGVFGHLTQQAVWALQKRHGLVRDAVVGPKTRAALEHDSALKPKGGSGTRFEVNLSLQLVLEVRDGTTFRVFNTSTGNGEPYQWHGHTYNANTYPGSFVVYSTYRTGWQEGPLGSLYRPAYFDRGRALHGSWSIPPYPASHGCCRLSTAATDLLWAGGAMDRGHRVLVV
ncbi:MAG: peptidoglycan-binding protein [Ornithinimicrobium sp.]